MWLLLNHLNMTVIRMCFYFSLRQMRLSGVLQRLRQNYWQNDIPRINKTSYGITFTAMAPIFIVLAFGMVIAISILFLECGFQRNMHIKLWNNMLWKQWSQNLYIASPSFCTTNKARCTECTRSDSSVVWLSSIYVSYLKHCESSSKKLWSIS